MMSKDLHKISVLSAYDTLNSPKETRTMTGFTIIELIVTLGVLSLIMALAIPSFRIMLMNSRLSSSTDLLVNALNYARNTALNQAMHVQVCPLSGLNTVNCGNNWGAGWIVLTQPSTGAATLLQSQQFSPTDPSLSAPAAGVVFDSHGLATTQSNFTLCDTRGGIFARSVEVLATGFVQAGLTPGLAVWNNSVLTCP